MITSRLTSKAQTTIPQPVRAALRLREGDDIAYAVEPGRVVLTRPRPWSSPCRTRRARLSASDRGGRGDVPVSDLDAAGLSAPSIVRPAKIATIEARDAERIGRLLPDDCVIVAKMLRGGLASVMAV